MVQAFKFNTEEVINRLLEGSLPAELSGLDPQTPLSGGAGSSSGPEAWPGLTASSSGAAEVADGVSKLSLGELSWTGLRADAEAGAAAAVSGATGPSRGASGRESTAGSRAHRVRRAFARPRTES